VFETLSGWKSSRFGTTELRELAPNERSYVNFLSEKIGVEIGLISTGPERSQTIVVRDSTLGGWLAT
jgi:adenylosuccinate synthase